MKISLMATLAFSAAVTAQAGLVARWDFNNYDPANPKSTGILSATVGEAAMPCYYAANGGRGSALVTDGTIGQMYVCTADSTDGDAAKAFNALGGGNYAIAIPKYSHIALPIPEVLLGQDHAFTIKIRCWIPAQGWHAFFNRDNVNGYSSGDSDLFITEPGRSKRHDTGIGGDRFGNNNNYKTGIGIGVWQTVTVSAGPQRHDVYLNETTEALYGNNSNNANYFNNPSERLTTYNGKQCLLLCADNDGEDGLMYIDYVAIYDDASAYEGKAPQYTKEGLTGEWTFPNANPLKATVGRDLEYYTRTGSASFSKRTDGVVSGDQLVRTGQNNSFKCYHSLSNNSSYTVVMDIRVSSTDKWHALFQPIQANDGDARLFLTNQGSGNNFWFKWTGRGLESTVAAVYGEWRRIVITHNATISGTSTASASWSNGVRADWNGTHNAEMKPVKGGFFLLLADDDGEDCSTDISYAAVYDRVLSNDEITELHSRPLAQRADETFIPTVAPAGVWAGRNVLAPVSGEALARTADGGYTWTRASAPAAATWVADLTLPAEQTTGGVLVKNANGVASGIYGTSSLYSGSFTTTTTPADFLSDTHVGTWGYWSETTLDRTTPHRLAVTWAANGRVHYYVDGHLWGQINPCSANTATKPTSTMTFFNGLGAKVTRLAAYDVALTPDEVASLGGPDPVPSRTGAMIVIH